MNYLEIQKEMTKTYNTIATKYEKEAMTRFEDLKLEYPKGCIIAKAKITDCIYVDDNFRKKVIPKNSNVYKSLNNTEWKGYGFKIEEVEEIKPIEINGKLSLWEYDYNVKESERCVS